MKKKLVSILLSLSMCAAYAMPLTTAAANEPAEAPTVVETAAPNKAWEPTRTTSKGVIEITNVAWDGKGSANSADVNVPFGDTVELGDKLQITMNVSGSSMTVSGGSADVVISSVNAKNDTTAKVAEKKVTGVKLTKAGSPIPVKISITKHGVTDEAQLKVNVVQKDISEAISGSYVKANDTASAKKPYKSMAEFSSKYKGKTGLTVLLSTGNSLPVKSIDSLTIIPEGSEVTVSDKHKYYVTTQDALGVSAGSISRKATIKVKAKGNYTGEYTIHGAEVKLMPQKINAGPETISGKTVTFGSVVDIENLTTDDGDEISGDDLKFKAVSKNIKVKYDKTTKKCQVSVKGVNADTTNGTKGIVEVSLKNNKEVKANIGFDLAPMDITNTATGSTVVAYNFTKALSKNYKNLPEFYDKFIGKDDKTPKASGLVVSYKEGTKDKKLKSAGKDFTVSAAFPGAKKGSGENSKAYVISEGGVTSVVSTAVITVTGVGNYSGTTTFSINVPLETQTVDVTCPALHFNMPDDELNVFSQIYLDESNLPVASSDKKADIIKTLKVKGDKNIKFDKDGYISVKKVPENNAKAKIEVSAKKNSKSSDASKTIEVTVNPCTKEHGTFTFDGTKFKAFKDVAAANNALAKTPLSFKGSGEKGKTATLKLNKDIEKIEPVGTVTAGAVVLKATLKGNYAGTVTGSVNIQFK